MTVAEDCGGYSNSVAENSFRRITTTVDLRLYFFDHDAFAAFNRFHITSIFIFNVAVRCASVIYSAAYLLKVMDNSP